MLDRRPQPKAADDGAPRITAAEVVLPCTELDATLAFFTERLGMRVDAVLPDRKSAPRWLKIGRVLMLTG